MISTWHYIALGAAVPLRKMETFGIKRHRAEDFSIRVLNMGVFRAGCNGGVGHLLVTVPANCHVSPKNPIFLSQQYYSIRKRIQFCCALLVLSIRFGNDEVWILWDWMRT